MELFFAKKPKIMIRPTDGKQVIYYIDIWTNAYLPPFTHICKHYSRIKELELFKKGLIINGEDYSSQIGFDINEVIFTMYERYNVKKIRFLNYFLDINIDCNKVNCFDVVSFLDVLKTDRNAVNLDIIFLNADINFQFYITF